MEILRKKASGTGILVHHRWPEISKVSHEIAWACLQYGEYWRKLYNYVNVGTGALVHGDDKCYCAQHHMA